MRRVAGQSEQSNTNQSRTLFNAPTMLYVVELVARMHHAVVYEMKTAAAPEKAIAKIRKFRPSAGLQGQRIVRAVTHKFWPRLSTDQSSSKSEKRTRTGTLSALLRKRTSTSCFVSDAVGLICAP